MVPNRAITSRICRALHNGQAMDLACIAAGVDAPTLKRWLALGEAAYQECEEEDPHSRFFEAFVKALEYADQAVEARRTRPVEPGPESPSRHQVELKRAENERSVKAPPLSWVVVEEAPIEIVIGARPPWVYETHSASPPVRPPKPPRPTGPEETTFEETPTSQANIEGVERRRDPTLGEVVEALGVLLVALTVLFVAFVLVLVVVPVGLASFALIILIGLALELAYRWRAGVIALRGGTTRDLLVSGPVTWNPCGWGARPVGLFSPGRTAGSVALSGRLRPQRE